MNNAGREWAAYIAQVNKVETAKATAAASEQVIVNSEQVTGAAK